MEPPHTFAVTYAPIRAQIQASIETDDDQMVTDICLMVAAIAHDRQHEWLAQMATYAVPAREALKNLEDVQQLWPEAIAAVRAVSEHIADLCRQVGLPSSRIDAVVNEKVHREFFHLPWHHDG